LPGRISDYHWAINACCITLWEQRHTEPWVAHTIERLCWLAIRLYETHCEGQGGHTFGYSKLVEMYSREGYLHEAIALVQRAQLKDTAAGAQIEYTQIYESLQKRMAALEAEGAS
jgi:hypothetical protein